MKFKTILTYLKTSLLAIEFTLEVYALKTGLSEANNKFCLCLGMFRCHTSFNLFLFKGELVSEGGFQRFSSVLRTTWLEGGRVPCLGGHY